MIEANYWVFLLIGINLLLQLLLNVWVERQQVSSVAQSAGGCLVTSHHEGHGVAEHLHFGELRLAITTMHVLCCGIQHQLEKVLVLEKSMLGYPGRIDVNNL